MALVTLADPLQKADREGYAIGAFNCNNMEIVQSIVTAAEEENSPVIIQASQGAIKYAGLNYIIALARQAAEGTAIPVVLHLDHGTSFEQVMQCIRFGFTSVMYDGSGLPLQENIDQTRKVVDIARVFGVSVEAELGRLGGLEDDISVSDAEALFTDPAEAEQFVNETGVDALAIAIGTAHGQYKGTPKIDFDRLAEINRRISCPLVLHGASGLSEEAINRAIELGVRKINIDTNIREAFMGGMRSALESNPSEIDPRKVIGPARNAAVKVIREKIKLFGSSGKG